MGFYSTVVFPRIYDLAMDKPAWAKHRQAQLAEARGDILEIGIGTGLNLAHYPPGVSKITAVDPNPGMNRVLRRRIARTGIEVDLRQIRSEQMPLAGESFDFVVSTLVLCSIPDASRALAEVLRVLRPGGRFLFFEHGLSPDPRVARWQRRLTPIQRWVGDGCRLDVDMRALLARQPFAHLALDNFQLEQTPKTHGWIYRGFAVK